jgi:uncharacterized protein (TIGR02246 family)
MMPTVGSGETLMAGLRVWALAALGLAMSAPAAAQSADDAAARALVGAEEAAFNAHDAAAYGAFLETDADVVTLSGMVVHGRAAYVAQLGGLFAGPLAQLRIHAEQIGVKMLSPDVTLVQIGWSASGAGFEGVHSIENQVLRRAGDRWLVASSQETEIASDRPAPAMSPSAQATPAAPKPARKCLLARGNGDCLIYK